MEKEMKYGTHTREYYSALKKSTILFFKTQGLMFAGQALLPLESLHQPFLYDGYFQDRVS
jgi:hypothetical protein